MTPRVNLHILVARFTQLSSSAFFDPAFRKFCERTLDALAHVDENWSKYPDDVIRTFLAHAWAVIRFLSGSRSGDAPHETQYVLRKALKQWIDLDALISSAALEDIDFFLQTLDLWEHISNTLNHFDVEGYKPLLVRIGSPISYRNRPIFCGPLFHELGHFVDTHYQVTNTSMLLSGPGPTPPQYGGNHQLWMERNRRHRMEHFADLFSACYVGYSSSESLKAIAPNASESLTHPATTVRCDIIEKFLTGRSDPIIDLLQNSLATRGKQPLSIQFKTPDLKSSFDQILTYPLKDEAELFGVFEAGWSYLHEQLEKPSAPWTHDSSGPYVVEKTVNDLVEKSIRNFEIREKWSDGAAH